MFVTTYVDEFDIARKQADSGDGGGRQKTTNKLVCPSKGWVRVNMDVAIGGGVGTGLGGVAHNMVGYVRWCFAEVIDSMMAMDIGEELAARRGLEVAINMGELRVELEVVSKILHGALIRGKMIFFILARLWRISLCLRVPWSWLFIVG